MIGLAPERMLFGIRVMRLVPDVAAVPAVAKRWFIIGAIPVLGVAAALIEEFGQRLHCVEMRLD